MLATLRRIFWKMVALVSPEPWLLRILRRKAQALRDELEGKLTDKFVEVLFYSMDVAFLLLPSYRRNLRGFHGSYVLRTADQQVVASALFNNEKMSVASEAVASPNVTILFKNPAALRRFLFSKDQDIMASLLENDVEVDGNLNYVYKLGYMARDLTRRLGIA